MFFLRLLFLGEDRFGPPQVDDDVAPLEPLDEAIDQVGDPVAVFLVNDIALRLPDLLVDDLLGRLGGDSPQPLGRLGNFHHVVHLGGIVDLLGLRQGEFQVFVVNVLDHPLDGEHLQGAILTVETGGKLFPGLEIFSGSGEDGVLDGRDDDIDIDTFLPADLLNGLK